jgi:hypothetical protein
MLSLQASSLLPESILPPIFPVPTIKGMATNRTKATPTKAVTAIVDFLILVLLNLRCFLLSHLR